MPKVTIREIDNTGSDIEEFSDYTVFVPGIQLTITTTDETTKETVDTPFNGLISSVSTFKQFLANKTADQIEIIEKDKGFVLAKELVNKGLIVYYAGAYTAYDADDGHITTWNKQYDEETGEELTEWDPEVFFHEFADKAKYDLRFITIGGLPLLGHDGNEVGTSTERIKPVHSYAALRCASDRGDAVAVLDIPQGSVQIIDAIDKGQTPEDPSTWIYSYKFVTLRSSYLIDTWVNEIYGDIANEKITRNGVSWLDAEKKTETRGRYGSIWGPKCTCTIDGEPTLINCSQDYLVAFGNMISKYPSWFAAAGSIRGVSGYNNLVPTMLFGDSDVDIFQRRALSTVQVTDPETGAITTKEVGLGHVATNVVSEIRPYGYILWGNRTMHPLNVPEAANSSNATVQLVASSFLNIRHLCIDIKKTLYRVCRQLSFEPNSDVLWTKFENAISPLLDRMKANQGINGYQIIQVPTRKKALLVARIKIVPIEAVEDFDITVELSDSLEPVAVAE